MTYFTSQLKEMDKKCKYEKLKIDALEGNLEQVMAENKKNYTKNHDFKKKIGIH